MDDKPAPDQSAAHAPTHVVTCFLVRHDRGPTEVLLVRRSERVRTYLGRWAGISGYVEADTSPLEQAYIELTEETGLPRARYRLVRQGTPIPVPDTEHGLNWMVHPYLFETDDPNGIRLDWEAAESRWVNPADLLTLPTVPALAAAYQQVAP